ncbi:MAG: hypothetical protein AMS25_18575 [Gemmatimonas sp. SM23_52]|nr:MAG: hypothetical protein AMS25_18575 [Gemmatimonas sp. SM23_52]
MGRASADHPRNTLSCSVFCPVHAPASTSQVFGFDTVPSAIGTVAQDPGLACRRPVEHSARDNRVGKPEAWAGHTLYAVLGGSGHAIFVVPEMEVVVVHREDYDTWGSNWAGVYNLLLTVLAGKQEVS